MKPKLYDTIFTYNPNRGTKFDESITRIRPSSINDFFEAPSAWYREQILKEERLFVGNAGSTLGNVLHYCYECALTNKPLYKGDVDDALAYHYGENPGMYDLEELKNLYPIMLNTVLNEYIQPLKKKGIFVEVEREVVLELSPSVVTRGYIDLFHGTTVCDWKNVSKKPNTDSIPFKYKSQLMTYALGLKRLGINIEYIEIIYVVQPTKTLPCRCFVVKQKINDSDWLDIEDTLNLMAESISIVKEKPELTHLIFKSMSLKQ